MTCGEKKIIKSIGKGNWYIGLIRGPYIDIDPHDGEIVIYTQVRGSPT